MCTVIYIPVKEGYLLCSCRDESTQRSKALPPGLRQWGQGTLLCPIDTQAGGTWIAATEHGESAVIFNGAFSRHEKKVYYPTSRGIVLTRLLGEKPLMEKWENENLEAIEPFSLIHAAAGSLYRFSWDGTTKYKTVLEPGRPHLWSSVTLYPPLVRHEREREFRNWVKRNGTGITSNHLLDFLLQAMPGDPENRFIMQRGKTETVSITLLRQPGNAATMYYADLKTGFTGITEGKNPPEKTFKNETLEAAATSLV